jgi:two-component system LytT family response regulator
MITAIIIDDEPNSVELITNLIQLLTPQVTVLGTADSVESGYKLLQNQQPDLIFLDIEMSDGSGFDLLKKLDKINFKLIFITGHHEFALTAFKYSAIDYLMKPLSPTDFANAVKKAEQSITNEELGLKISSLLHNLNQEPQLKKKIVLKTLDRVYSIYAEDILRFESSGSYTTVYLMDGKKIVVSRLLKEFDEMLSSNGFARVHQSHLVNVEQIFCFEKADNHVVLTNNTIIPVSLRKKDFVMDLITKG